MAKATKYVDIGILIISLFLLGLFVNWQIANNDFIINGTIALFLFSVSLIFKIFNFRKGQYPLFILLVILVFNIKLSFQISNGDGSTTYYSESFPSLGFNPIVLLVLMVYIIVNLEVIAGLFKWLFHGSVKEQEQKKGINVNFYYDKFSRCSADELKGVLKMYNEYPEEAQIALEKIQQERNIK
jgi:hypothetical protein